jgi:hypothetical protein
MRFGEYLEEAKKIEIKLGGDNGSSLAKTFTEEESKQIIDALKANPKSESKLKDYIYSLEDEDEKYSDDAIVRLGGYQFSLYASYGILRLGGGGNSTTANSMIKGISAKDLIQALPNAKIR